MENLIKQIVRSNFWDRAKAPLFILAPKEDVTDTSFRELVLLLSSPNQLNVVYTEFTSTDGLCHPVGRDKVNHRLRVSESERKLLKEQNVKIVAQVWGNKPEKFSKPSVTLSKILILMALT